MSVAAVWPTMVRLSAVTTGANPTKFNNPCADTFWLTGIVIWSSPFRAPNTLSSLASNTLHWKLSSNTCPKPCIVKDIVPSLVPPDVSVFSIAVHSSFISPAALVKPFLPTRVAVAGAPTNTFASTTCTVLTSPTTILFAIKDPLVDLRVAECMSSDHYAYMTKNIVLYLSQEDKKIRLKKLAELTTKKIDNGGDLFDVIEFVEEQMKSISEIKGSDIPDIKKQL